MAGGMPILGEEDVVEAARESVDGGNDLVSTCDGEAASLSRYGRAEVVLEVDDEESVGGQKE